MPTDKTSLTPQEFEALQAMALSRRGKPLLQAEIRKKLVNLGLIEQRLGNYVVTSRGHARVQQGI